jgi:hypothetical protein
MVLSVVHEWVQQSGWQLRIRKVWWKSMCCVQCQYEMI